MNRQPTPTPTPTPTPPHPPAASFRAFDVAFRADPLLEEQPMNMNTTAYKASVMQARADGADIEVRPRAGLVWRLTTIEPAWNWVALEYRVAEHRAPVAGFAAIELGSDPFVNRNALLVFATHWAAQEHAKRTGVACDIVQMREWSEADQPSHDGAY